jgi:hypothetical protein
MAKTDTKPTYEAGKYYKVKLAQAVTLLPGVTLRPGGEHRIEGALLESFKDAVLEAREDEAPE